MRSSVSRSNVRYNIITRKLEVLRVRVKGDRYGSGGVARVR